MSESLRTQERKGEAVAQVAAKLPATLAEAVRAYVAVRTTEIKRFLWDLDATSQFRAQDISWQCGALATIEKEIAGPSAEPEKPAKKRKSNVVAIVQPPARSQRQQVLDLADLLKPEEFAGRYADALSALKDQAERSIMLQENIRASQCMGAEVDEFTRFLQRVAEAAIKERGALEHDMRGGVPRDPRQIVGGVRPGM